MWTAQDPRYPRGILEAVFYFLKSGCQWRLLPHDFPLWHIDGTCEKIDRVIRERCGLA